MRIESARRKHLLGLKQLFSAFFSNKFLKKKFYGSTLWNSIKCCCSNWSLSLNCLLHKRHFLILQASSKKQKLLKMTETQVNKLQRTITFTTAQDKLRPQEINDSSANLDIPAPRKFVINQAETAESNTKIQVNLPARLVGTLVVLPTMQTLGLILLNGLYKEHKHWLLNS